MQEATYTTTKKRKQRQEKKRLGKKAKRNLKFSINTPVGGTGETIHLSKLFISR
jgi:hypothetical protein